MTAVGEREQPNGNAKMMRGPTEERFRDQPNLLIRSTVHALWLADGLRLYARSWCSSVYESRVLVSSLNSTVVEM